MHNILTLKTHLTESVGVIVDVVAIEHIILTSSDLLIHFEVLTSVSAAHTVFLNTWQPDSTAMN